MVSKQSFLAFTLVIMNGIAYSQEVPDIEAKESYAKEVADYPHLSLLPFKKRHEIVAEFVRDCDSIIEIGGGAHPMSMVIKDKPVIVIDKKLKKRGEGNAIHVRKKFEDWQDQQASRTNYAVVILGLELIMNRNGWLKLYDLIERSKKTVIEYSEENKEARKQIKDIRASITNKATVTEQDLNLSSHFCENDRVFAHRKMVIFE